MKITLPKIGNFQMSPEAQNGDFLGNKKKQFQRF
jgi:hypothetical protein